MPHSSSRPGFPPRALVGKLPKMRDKAELVVCAFAVFAATMLLGGGLTFLQREGQHRGQGYAEIVLGVISGAIGILLIRKSARPNGPR